MLLPKAPFQVRSKILGRLCASAIALFALGIVGQSSNLLVINQADQRLVHVSPTIAEEVRDPSGEFSLTLESHGDASRIVATSPNGTTRSPWYSSQSEARWFVYATKDQKFHEVENRIRVELKDASHLEKIASELGASRAQYYKGLEYGVLWLDPQTNPVGIAKQLKSDHRVKRATLEFKKPEWLPQ